MARKPEAPGPTTAASMYRGFSSRLFVGMNTVRKHASKVPRKLRVIDCVHDAGTDGGPEG